MKKKVENLPIKKSDNVFVQSNEFIQAKYKENMTFWELLIFGKMCTLIDPNDTDFKDYKIYVKDLIDFSGVVKGGMVYQYVMEASERLKQREISVTVKNEEGREETLDTYLVVGRKVPKNREENENMYIKLTFHPDLKPFLLQLKRDFTKLDIRSYKFLHTSTSIRLYHILKQFYGRHKHHPQLSLEELKEMLGVGDKYNPYNNFKQRILDEAQRRLLESTDIKFSYEEVKERKKVVGLIFHISENQPTWLNDNKTVEGEAEEIPHTFFDEIFPKVEKWGVSREVLTLLIDTQSEEAVRQGYAYTLFEDAQGRVKDNKVGFFINAVKNKYTSEAFEKEQKKAARVASEKAREYEISELRLELRELNDDYYLAINEAVRLLTQEDAAITDRAIETVKAENGHYFALKGISAKSLDVEAFRKDKILRGLVINQIMAQNPDAFEKINEEYLPTIRNMEQRLKALQR